MNKYIIINLNMFAHDSQVILLDEEGEHLQGSYGIEELPAIITELAHNSNVYNVKIIGADKYAQLIEFGIQQKEMTQYSERKIEIEVI